MSFSRLNQAKVKSQSVPAIGRSRAVRFGAASADASSSALSTRHDGDTLAQEQDILSLLSYFNAPVIDSSLSTYIQAIKTALYARDYATAFSRPVRGIAIQYLANKGKLSRETWWGTL